jgi:hypothetical protein
MNKELKKSPNWDNLPREDLNMINKMIEAGWTPEVSYNDQQYGRVTPDKVPHHSLNYKKKRYICMNSQTWK